MRTEDVLTLSETGLWRWDHATGLITLDAIAARLIGLADRYTTATESGVRSRVQVEDWIELYRVAALAAAEDRVAEGRLRIIGPEGTVQRTLRTRLRAYGEGGEFTLAGTLTEIPEEATALLPRAAGDWRLSREAFLLDAGRALAEARTSDEVLRVASSLALPGFSPDGMAVYGLDGDELRIVGFHGYATNTPATLHRAHGFFSVPTDSDYPAAEAIRTGRAVYLTSPEEYERRYPHVWKEVRSWQRQAWAYLPLMFGGRPIAAWMASFPHPVAFTPDERSVLTTVARMLAQALARTQAYETERELSADLQHTMAPAANPAIPGLRLVARYVPTGGGLQIGGDWYDVIPLPSGRVALVIGDVQGHDVRAAGVMAQLRIALRAYAAEGHRPDAVLSRATRFLAGFSSGRGDTYEDDRFATCLYAEIDPRTGSVEVARAGHPDLAIRLHDGTTVRRATEGGPPLGVVPDCSYPTTRIALQPDETLLLSTDGLLETGGHDLESGWTRLRTVLENGAADDLDKLADAMIEEVHGTPSRRGTGPLTDRREDDIALLLVRRTEGDGGVRRTVINVNQAAPARIAEARRLLAELLHDWPDPDRVDASVLMASEVLTNVLVHTDSDALLTAEVRGLPGARLLRVEVADTSDDMPHRREPGELASSGRGLLLMEALASSWGVAPRGAGKTTWFEVHENG